MTPPITLETLTANDISALSFEDSSTLLSAVVRRLQEGNVSLSSLTHFYDLGRKLEQHCRNLLEDARIVLTNLDSPSASGDD